MIPARGGSKGLPGKNIKMLMGKPLIAYTIEAAQKAKCIDRVIVTTDSQEIADVAVKCGAEVPFMRPKGLAEDMSSAVDVYLHAAEYMKSVEKEVVDKFMVLLPTAPLRISLDIDKSIELFSNRKASTLVSMKEAETPISWYYIKQNNDKVINAGFDCENMVSNRQLNKKYYIPNGAIYILDYNLLKTKRTYYDENTIMYLMPYERSIDIDTEMDFKYAEFLMKTHQCLLM